MGIPIPKRTVYGDPESPFHPLVKEIAFRNPMDEIVRFFEELHPHTEGEPLRVMVFNLCIEEDRQYDLAYFANQVNVECQFFDHNCPPLALIPKFCEAAKAWLDADEANVIAVHCEAGKSRTGLMICSLLLHMGMETVPEECVRNYGNARCHDGKGVTIPSQQRYIASYKMLLDLGGYTPGSRPLCVASMQLHDHPKKARYHLSIEQWNKAEYKTFQSWTDNEFDEMVEPTTLVEKNTFIGEWRCVDAAANVRAGYGRETNTVGRIRKGKILEEIESRRDPKDGVLRIKIKHPGNATDVGFTGWVSEKTADGEALFENAANREVYETDYTMAVDQSVVPEERVQQGVGIDVDGDFKVFVYKEKMNDQGESVKGDKLFYFWMHTAFLPAPDPETGEVTWHLAKEQLDKFKGGDDYLDSFSVTITLKDAATPGGLSEEEVAFRALKEERMDALREVCRKKDDGFRTTDQKAGDAIGAASKEVEAAIAANAEALAKAKSSVADTEEMKTLSAVGANQTVNAATVVSAGSQMFAAMGGSMTEKLEGTGIGADDLALLGSTQDPATALKENPEFVEKIKGLVVTYVQDAGENTHTHTPDTRHHNLIFPGWF